MRPSGKYLARFAAGEEVYFPCMSSLCACDSNLSRLHILAEECCLRNQAGAALQNDVCPLDGISVKR